jgi:hypothetical protein
MKRWGAVASAAIVVAMTTAAQAQEPTAPPAPSPDLFDSGKLLATSGVSQIEGAAGGGLTPWAVITGYETRDAIGANAHYTFINTPSFTLHSTGASLGLYDRVELSYAREIFDTGATGAKLGLGNGFTFNEDVVGAKLRVAGDAVYDQDTLMPQVALGLQYKRNDQPAVLHAIGAKSADGVDFYGSATKLFIEESVLLNATVRASRANQIGILGFGGDRNNDYSAEFEGSAAYLLSRKIAIGAEYRENPNNLKFAAENRWLDAFVAYFPTRNISLTLAAVDLGDIAGQHRQRGVFLSVQAGF